MKNFFIVSLLLFTCLLIAKFQDIYIYQNEAEVIINLENLNSNQTIESIKKDFSKLSGVEYIDGSLMTGSIILKVQDNDIEITDFENLFNRWGCKIKDINYRILNIR